MSKHHTHLTSSERMLIEQGLNEHMSLRKIATLVGKYPTTIQREIIEHSTESLKDAAHRITNRCIHKMQCVRHQLCIDQPNGTRPCPRCARCNKKCKDFKEKFCPQLSVSPYVCNGCHTHHQCVLRKCFYDHKVAEKDYRETLVTCREGANITEEELLKLDAPLPRHF